MPAKLRLADKTNHRDYVFTDADLPITIGRSSSADLRINDSCASRRHCEIAGTPDGLVVRDLGAKNGTVLNDEPIIEKLLEHGDVIRVGLSLFEVDFCNRPEAAEREERGLPGHEKGILPALHE